MSRIYRIQNFIMGWLGWLFIELANTDLANRIETVDQYGEQDWPVSGMFYRVGCWFYDRDATDKLA